MSHYVIKNKHVIPGFLGRAIASWIVSVTAISVVLLTLYVASAFVHRDVFALIPHSLMVILDLVGAYAGIGGICLYMTMWTYWIGVQRAPIGARIGWLLALVFLLHYGALIYAIVVWKNDVVRSDKPMILDDLRIRES
jgi:hypothetical protein